MADEPTTVDALQADAAPREFPKGSPELIGYMRLPFRKRARFFKMFSELQAQQTELEKLDKKRKRVKNPSQEMMMEQATGLYELYGAMDELLEMASADPEKYRDWVESNDDDSFQELFSIYIERSQPGEASSSSS